MMKTLFSTLSICCLFYWTSGMTAIHAQQIIAKPIPFLDQLSSNEIRTLHQDKQGFIWIGTPDGLVRYDGYETQIFNNNYETPQQLINNNINCFADDEHHIWVGTDKGVNLIRKTDYQIIPFPDPHIMQKPIRDLLTDRNGQTWVATRSEVFKCSSDLKIQKKYIFSSSSSSFQACPNAIFEDHAGNIWVTTWGLGIFKYSPNDDSFLNLPQIGNSNNPIRMFQDNEDRYWITTWGDGIWNFLPGAPKDELFRQQTINNPVRNTPEMTFYDIIQDNTYKYLWALSHFGLYTLKANEHNELEIADTEHLSNKNYPIDKSKSYSRVIKDHNGNLWLGAFDRGYSITFEKNKIENHIIDDIQKGIGLDANIICLNKDSQGIIWFNQARYGLCLYNEQSRKIVYGPARNSLYSIDIGNIEPSRKDDTMWLGSREASKVWKMKQDDMRISTLEEIDLFKIDPSPGFVSQVFEDRNGNLWIGTENKLFTRGSDSTRVSKTPFEISNITDVAEDENGYIWISNKQNIYQLSYDGHPKIVKKHIEEFAFLNDESINSLCIDENNQIWFSTSLGRLITYNPKTQQITDQTVAWGLKGNQIRKIRSCGENIWIVYNKYIVRHDLKQAENTTYSVADDNIFISSFRYGAAFIDIKGVLYAGGHKGFIKIMPANDPPEKSSGNHVLITDVKVDSHSLLFSPHKQNAKNSVCEITLPSDARNIEILFSSFSYTHKKKIKYAYKMDGMDTKWTHIDEGKHSAFYNQLNKGKYLFRIKATDQYGNWIEEESVMTIHRLPAIYETWYAYCLYAIIIIAFIYYSFRIYIRRIKEKNTIKLQEELTLIKLNYFTNISHELLTPLTIISCVADDLEQNDKTSENQISILRANVNRLKRLLQHILDFRKVENGKMIINVCKGDISSFTAEIVASNFQTLAQKKDIRLITQIEEGIQGYLDFDKLDKILFNLLSNAIKYTPEHKQIHLTLKVMHRDGYRYLFIQVEDEGIGIPAKEIKLIFNKFYNNKRLPGCESNGIGLSLTKELITLHHGSIEVQSEANKGSVFTVELPIDKEIYSKQEIQEATVSADEEAESMIENEKSNDKPCILFVDDNKDLRELMRNILGKSYQLITAKNGIEGLELLSGNNIDIAICDLMMPEMDGLEFCRRLKADVQTNHIPVLMLTAKNGTEDQIECYKAGAESYIAKPFEMKILQARIENLLKARESRQLSFRSKTEMNISTLDYQSVDEQFLNSAIECIETHLSESDFDIPQMAMELNMSTSTLTRKFKVITGLTPLGFIRNIKLKHACTMLKDKSVNISEVAYATGFSVPKYFTKCFKDEFGITPTEYQEKMKNAEGSTLANGFHHLPSENDEA